MPDTLTRLPKTQPETCMETRLLADHLRQLRRGEVMTYAAMRALTGLDIQRKRRDLLGTALRMVLRESQKTFGPVTGIGMMCLTSVGILGVGETGRQRFARSAHRLVQKLACADPADLTEHQQYKLLAYTSIYGAIAALSHIQTVQRAVQLQGTAPAQVDPKHYQNLFAGV